MKNKSSHAIILAVLVLCSCRNEERPAASGGRIVSFSVEASACGPGTRSAFSGNESRVNTAQVLVYDSSERLYADEYFPEVSSGMKMRLSSDGTYRFLVLCNCAEIPAGSLPATLAQARSFDVSAAADISPSGLFGRGLPMACDTVFSVTSDMSAVFNVHRLVSRWDIRYENMDAGRLGFTLSGVTMRNCATDFQPWCDWRNGVYSRPVNACSDGDWSGNRDLQLLGLDYSEGGSQRASFYVLENGQGIQPGSPDYESRKPENVATIKDRATYAQVVLTYPEESDYFRSSESGSADGDVVYRVYLGRNSSDDFNIVRNTSNTLTIRDNKESIEFDLSDGNDSWQAEYNLVKITGRVPTWMAFKYPSYSLSTVDPAGAAVANPASAFPLLGRTISYRSEDESVATVDRDGIITATGKGSVRILASVPAVAQGSVLYRSATAVCSVDVSDRPCASLMVEPSVWTGSWGNSFALSAMERRPEGGILTWYSTDSDVASVSADGVVSALRPGRCIIAGVLSADGYASATASCAVTVTRRPANLLFTPDVLRKQAGSGMTWRTVLSSDSPGELSTAAYMMGEGGRVNINGVAYTPAGAVWPAIDADHPVSNLYFSNASFQSGVSYYCTVVQGETDLYEAGEATFVYSATSEGEGVRVTPDDVTLLFDGSATLTGEIIGQNTGISAGTLEWTSSDPAIAFVSPTTSNGRPGEITGVTVRAGRKEGTAVITATDSFNHSGSCIVRVKRE